MDFKSKYLKYKNKYLSQKNNIIPNSITQLEKYGGACKSVVEQLDDNDKTLIFAALTFSKEYCNEQFYPLVAAMRHNDGSFVYGLAANGPLSNSVHGEHSVLTNARIKDKNIDNFSSLVCVSHSNKIKSPCGNCRELLKYHYPNLNIILYENDDTELSKKSLIKIKSKYLLPYPYQSGQTLDNSKLDKPIDVVTK